MSKSATFRINLAAAAALFALLPAAASAEYLIPDGNSAVNQYTEGLPTAGGERDTKGSGERPVRPAKALGADNARRLEQQGPEGAALAELAAETAPTAVVDAEPEAEPQRDGRDTSEGGDGPRERAEQDAVGGVSGGNGGEGSGGSSAAGELIRTATGLSDNGGLSPVLPVVLLAMLAWAVVFALRQRRAGDGGTAPAP